MPSFGDKLRGWLGGAPAKNHAKPSSAKPAAKKAYVTAKSDRSALIAEAMDAYRRQRTLARDVLDHTLASLRAKPPAAMQDPEGLERLLALHRAHADLKKLLAHDLKRFLVLVGLRQWLGEGRQPPAPAPPRKVVAKR